MLYLTGLTKGYIKIGEKIKKKGRIYWKCICTACGKELLLRTDQLRNTNKGDCGCLKSKAQLKISAGQKPEEKRLLVINNNILAYIDKEIYYKIGDVLEEKEIWEGKVKRWNYVDKLISIMDK